MEQTPITQPIIGETHKYLIDQGGIAIALIILMFVLVGLAHLLVKYYMPWKERMADKETAAEKERRDHESGNIGMLVSTMQEAFEASTKTITTELQRLAEKADADRKDHEHKLDQDKQNLFSCLHEISEKLSAIDTDTRANTSQLQAHASKLDEHEGRIVSLEKR